MLNIRRFLSVNHLLRFSIFSIVIILVVCTLFLLYLLNNLSGDYNIFTLTTKKELPKLEEPAPFPIGVFPLEKKIIENAEVSAFLNTELDIEDIDTPKLSYLRQLEKKLSRKGIFQQLAAAGTRILVIWPGDRKEEIVANFGRILNWDAAEKVEFVTLMSKLNEYEVEDGYYLPGSYTVPKDATPNLVAEVIYKKFYETVIERYEKSVADIVSPEETLIIASLLEREAYSFSDMRQISGVIWNRIFLGMPLQIDASLQYVKGTDDPTSWWPVPKPADKYLDSPYNTYQHTGLPPNPISNPSPEAILAALNPAQGSCLFYFHSQNEIYCSDDYTDHVRKLKEIYGQGR